MLRRSESLRRFEQSNSFVSTGGEHETHGIECQTTLLYGERGQRTRTQIRCLRRVTQRSRPQLLGFGPSWISGLHRGADTNRQEMDSENERPLVVHSTDIDRHDGTILRCMFQLSIDCVPKKPKTNSLGLVLAQRLDCCYTLFFHQLSVSNRVDIGSYCLSSTSALGWTVLSKRI